MLKELLLFLGKHFETLAVIKSKPGDFLFKYFRIKFLIT